MDDARELRQQGIRSAKAGNRDEARDLLQRSIRLDPTNEAAWLWLASVARDNRERVFCLQKLLEINPQNETARKALQAATQPQQSSLRRVPNAPSTPAAQPQPPAPTIMQAPGVPVPMPDQIAQAQHDAEPVVNSYLTPLPKTVRWVHKTHRRAGEGDIVVFRTYIAAGIVAVLVILIVAGIIVVQTNDSVREIVLGPSATPTSSPTVTPTFTPGLTPTPSATPRLTLTPSETPPPNLQAAKLPELPRATSVYPEILERAVYDSAMKVLQGDVVNAIPTLEQERKLTFDTRFEPNPYYYKALGLMKEKRFSEALATLDEAIGRVDERPDDLRIAPFLESGYAQVYWAQAQERMSAGDPVGARDALDQVRTHAQTAIDGDRRLAPAYLMLAKADEQVGDYNDALEVLNRGLAVAELVSNTELIMEKSQIYFVQRDYEHALYQSFLALYIDPTIEAAYQMKIQIALVRNRPGDAVLAAEDYLHFYPGSTTAFRLMGDARVAEHKDDQALAAYTQGLSANGTDADCLKMLEGRAQIYERQRRFALALDDYDRLYTLTRDQQFRALRMQAAFAAGKFDQALSDANALAVLVVATPEATAEATAEADATPTPAPTPQANAEAAGIVTAGEIALVRGASLVEQAQPGDTTTYTQAAQYLNQALVTADIAFSPQRGTANEYLARAQLALGDTDSALTAINAALAAGETGSRHYWRGQILQAKGDNAGAANDYEWVLSWSEVFPYPFRVDAEDRLKQIK